MPQLVAPETFEFLARFFLAGWMFLSARSWWVKGERPKPNEVLFEAIVLSLINQLISLGTLPLIELMATEPNAAAVLVFEVVLQPILLGILIGWFAQRNGLPDGFRRLLMPAVKPVGSSFQYSFDKLQNPTYVIMSFNDGRRIYGFFGETSLSDSDVDSGGIYLERLYVLDDEEEWHQVSGTAWVGLNGLETVEFRQAEDI